MTRKQKLHLSLAISGVKKIHSTIKSTIDASYKVDDLVLASVGNAAE